MYNGMTGEKRKSLPAIVILIRKCYQENMKHLRDRFQETLTKWISNYLSQSEIIAVISTELNILGVTLPKGRNIIKDNLCSNPVCSQHLENNDMIRMRKCTKCKRAQYCDEICQVQHWRKGHSKLCLIEKL